MTDRELLDHAQVILENCRDCRCPECAKIYRDLIVQIVGQRRARAKRGKVK